MSTDPAHSKSWLLMAAFMIFSCSDLTGCDSDSKNQQTGTGGTGGAGSGSLPPIGATAVESWLATGAYKQWRCEPAVHAAREPSPHGFNRICSNERSRPTPRNRRLAQGAAAVKELYANATTTTPVGYAVYLKTADDSAGGANWYWYERVPLNGAAPHDANGVVADGMGSAGTSAMQICVGCHGPAGSDAAHTPTAGGRDLVYTPVH